jgi:predicted component of type VI protein secretion system
MTQWPQHSALGQAALILEKDNSYWVYHRGVIEDDEEEKAAPSEKVWLIVKFADQMSSSPYKGCHRLRIGDTVKFGRVRFKVIMMHNEVDGEQVFKESRFSHKAKTKAAAAKVSRMSHEENTESEDEDEGDDGAEERDDIEEEEEEGFGAEEEDHGMPSARVNELLRNNSNLIINNDASPAQ